MSIAELTQTHGWKNFMGKLYGIGAAVVIIGALFKIMHWPGAGPMLVAGLGTEAVIFFFSAFEPLHEELDWTLVYPELAGLSDSDEISGHGKKNNKQQEVGTTSGGHALAKFDEMLEKSGGANLFEKLGTGLSTLTDRVKDLSDISNAALATNEYTQSMKNATLTVDEFSKNYNQSVTELSSATTKLTQGYNQSAESLSFSMDNLADTYSKASQKVSDSNDAFVANYQQLSSSMNIDFTALKDGNKVYGDHVSVLNKNLSALNAIFEMQLNEADIEKMMEDLHGSVANSSKYNAEITKLGNRLEALNGVYGKMLSAMNVKVD